MLYELIRPVLRILKFLEDIRKDRVPHDNPKRRIANLDLNMATYVLEKGFIITEPPSIKK